MSELKDWTIKAAKTEWNPFEEPFEELLKRCVSEAIQEEKELDEFQSENK